MHIAEQLLDDRTSGLKTDADGRRYFRQRRVVFRTIGVNAADLYDGDWLGFERALEPLDWSGWPTHAAIREFSRLSSERFLTFWYRVLDVSVARALSGRGKEIFRVDFFHPSPLLDIGIPAEQTYSTVPVALHEKIIREYERSRARAVGGSGPARRVYYLSDYLTGLSDDVSEALAPYARLWDLHRRRRELLGLLEEMPRRLSARWSVDGSGRTLQERLGVELDAYLVRKLAAFPAPRTRTLESESLRHLIYRLRSDPALTISPQDRAEIFRYERALELPRPAGRLYEVLIRPGRLREIIRSALVQNSAAHRLDLRLARLAYLFRDQDPGASTESVRRRLAAHRESFRGRLLALRTEFVEGAAPDHMVRRSRALADLGEFLSETSKKSEPPFEEILARWQMFLDARSNEEDRTEREESDDSPEDSPATAQRALARESFDMLLDLRRVEGEILRIHRDFAGSAPAQAASGESEADPPPRRYGKGDPRYHRLEALELPADLEIGNPFHEFRILQYARELLLLRLRPVRRTASSYSLNPGHRHGAMTLNPVMKLWKDRPNGPTTKPTASADVSVSVVAPGAGADARGNKKNLRVPELAGLEMNTRQSVDCLIRLAELVDPALGERELERYRTVRAKRGQEDLSNLSFFLLPGSAFPLREIHRLDFPEFRGRVIGESRSPAELGVPKDEDAVLTGAWYQKNNHALYYPVGGDNGALIRLIWQSGRSPGPPAFFFALGQMVHDCLPENLTYFRSGEVTFRECIEDYYVMEDRVRKNRGEKTGRRRLDNSRPAIRFMFAVCYARLVLEALTGSSQSHFRHRPTERWLGRHIGLPLLAEADRSTLKGIRARTRELIESYDEPDALGRAHSVV